MRNLREIYEQMKKMKRLISSTYMLIMSLSLSKRLKKKIVGIISEGGNSCHSEEQHMRVDNTFTNYKAIGVKSVYKIKRTADGESIGTRRGL